MARGNPTEGAEWLDLPGPLAVRWYGLSYLAGFIGCILLLRHWSRRKSEPFDMLKIPSE